MSGRDRWRDLVKPIDEDPVWRARVEEISRAYEAPVAGAGAGPSDDEPGEMAETYVPLSNPETRAAVDEAEAQIERGEGLSYEEAFGEER